MNELRKRIVNWIEEQVREAGAKGIVVGMSGGVDSSLVAILSKEAVGDNLLGLILHCQSRREDAEEAKSLAQLFGIRTEYIDLTPIFEHLLTILPKGERITLANLKARLRMSILYYFANHLNYLVVGTGNKSEVLVGYFTKYGDGGVDILPLGDLLKTQVREMAKLVGIPPKIIEKIPSAGLWEGQTDEGELGITYEELDRILIAIDIGKTEGLPPEKLSKVTSLINASIHKRQSIPVFKC